MINNDILRRFRFAMDLSDETMIQIFKLQEQDISKEHIATLFKKEEDPGFVLCSDQILSTFLDGFIISRRGKQEGAPVQNQKSHLSNNMILRKIKIALKLKDTDILHIMELARFKVSKSELSALFRKPSHPNYKECGNQFLRNFLIGLTNKYRGL